MYIRMQFFYLFLFFDPTKINFQNKIIIYCILPKTILWKCQVNFFFCMYLSSHIFVLQKKKKKTKHTQYIYYLTNIIRVVWKKIHLHTLEYNLNLPEHAFAHHLIHLHHVHCYCQWTSGLVVVFFVEVTDLLSSVTLNSYTFGYRLEFCLYYCNQINIFCWNYFVLYFLYWFINLSSTKVHSIYKTVKYMCTCSS